ASASRTTSWASRTSTAPTGRTSTARGSTPARSARWRSTTSSRSATCSCASSSSRKDELNHGDTETRRRQEHMSSPCLRVSVVHPLPLPEAAMVQVCTKCSRATPPEAVYCPHDGFALGGHARRAGPIAVGAQLFRSPFVFPPGRTCRNFDELALACQE